MSIQNAGSQPINQSLFRRCYSLEIGPPGQTTALRYANFSTIDSSGKLIPAAPLRVEFEIEKNLAGTSNKSKITITNLSPKNRQFIKKGYLLRLQAGYNGLVQTIFFGNITPLGLHSERKGPDIVTIMECGDGESAMALTYLHKAYPPKTTLATIISDLIRQMGLADANNPLGVTPGIIVGIPNVVFERGYSVGGMCRDELTKLLKPQGLRWSVQNGAVQILPIGSHNQLEAIVLNSGSGLIDVPSQNDKYTEFKSLLNPKIVPGSLVKLESEENRDVDGFYKVDIAKYEGDTHGDKWNVSCKASTVTQDISFKLPAAAGLDLAKAVIG